MKEKDEVMMAMDPKDPEFEKIANELGKLEDELTSNCEDLPKQEDPTALPVGHSGKEVDELPNE